MGVKCSIEYAFNVYYGGSVQIGMGLARDSGIYYSFIFCMFYEH